MSAPTPEQDDLIHPLAKALTWTEMPTVRNAMFFVFGIITLGLAAVDFFIHRHEIFHSEPGQTIEAIPGFYAWMGFLSFVAAVFIGWGLRFLIMRPETYYNPEAGDE